jgi:hypothetical protein
MIVAQGMLKTDCNALQCLSCVQVGILLALASAEDGLEIDDSAGGDKGCAACQYGQIREFE